MYFVYLVHEIVKKILFNFGVLTLIGYYPNPVWGVPVVSLVIFGISYMLVRCVLRK